MFTGITSALRGIGGEFEINRVIGALGAFAYVVGAHVFVAYNVMWKGNPFNLTEYCIAFPGGLAVAVGAIAGATAWKDRGVATATVIRDTGAVPVAPPAGPPVPVEEPK